MALPLVLAYAVGGAIASIVAVDQAQKSFVNAKNPSTPVSGRVEVSNPANYLQQTRSDMNTGIKTPVISAPKVAYSMSGAPTPYKDFSIKGANANINFTPKDTSKIVVRQGIEKLDRTAYDYYTGKTLPTREIVTQGTPEVTEQRYSTADGIKTVTTTRNTQNVQIVGGDKFADVVNEARSTSTDKIPVIGDALGYTMADIPVLGKAYYEKRYGQAIKDALVKRGVPDRLADQLARAEQERWSLINGVETAGIIITGGFSEGIGRATLAQIYKILPAYQGKKIIKVIADQYARKFIAGAPAGFYEGFATDQIIQSTSNPFQKKDYVRSTQAGAIGSLTAGTFNVGMQYAHNLNSKLGKFVEYGIGNALDQTETISDLTYSHAFPNRLAPYKKGIPVPTQAKFVKTRTGISANFFGTGTNDNTFTRENVKTNVDVSPFTNTNVNTNENVPVNTNININTNTNQNTNTGINERTDTNVNVNTNTNTNTRSNVNAVTLKTPLIPPLLPAGDSKDNGGATYGNMKYRYYNEYQRSKALLNAFLSY